MQNQYDKLSWNTMLGKYPPGRTFSIQGYRRILSPEFPDFLNSYIQLPVMQRLSGIGLLCGTDWTPLYRNRFYYSRLDHSIGTALIVWNFTHDKIQTLAGLFHDIATPVFSHVFDFRNGDALTQTSTENATDRIIRSSTELYTMLKKDGITVEQISNYHLYPIADNDQPQLSADRLEYMFPSGAVLQGSWTEEETAAVYRDITVLKNEKGEDELGFRTVETAENYCFKFCETSHVLQLNENKLALQLLAEITTRAVQLSIISEEDCYALSEKEVIERFRQTSADLCRNKDGLNSVQHDFLQLFNTFLTMTHIEHTRQPLEDHFCVNLKVKQRYINPLVFTGGITGNEKARRLTEVSEKTAALIKDFLEYKDSPYGCVRLV